MKRGHRWAGVAALAWGLAGHAQTPPDDPATAGMERALQQADGPMRRIREAALLKAAAPLPPAAAAPALGTLPAAPEPLELAPALASVASLESLPSVGPPGALPALAAPLPDPATLPPPRLLRKVEPDLPAWLWRRGGGRTEVRVEMTIRADGSVADVVVPAARSELAQPIADAVRQWRYDAQPVARPNSVVLVISPG